MFQIDENLKTLLSKNLTVCIKTIFSSDVLIFVSFLPFMTLISGFGYYYKQY